MPYNKLLCCTAHYTLADAAAGACHVLGTVGCFQELAAIITFFL